MIHKMLKFQNSKYKFIVFLIVLFGMVERAWILEKNISKKENTCLKL